MLRPPLERQVRIRLLTIAAVAFLLRVIVRVLSREADFFHSGYSFLFELAQGVASGHGYAFAGLPPTVYRVPLYPLFLTAVTFGREAFYPVAIAHSLLGAATVFFVGVLSAELFGPGRERLRLHRAEEVGIRGEVSASARAGGGAPAPVKESRAGGPDESGRAGGEALIAAAIAAVYPYYVVHDTALQDTGLFTFLTLLSVLLLIRARRSMSGRVAACAGLALAAAVLTRSTIVPFAIFAPVWLALPMKTPATQRFNARARVALLCGATLLSGVAPWLVRAYVITGVPVLESDTGARLWDGNSPYTFSRYPTESIDLSKAAAIAALTKSELADLAAAGPNEVLADRWFLHRAITFMRENSRLTVVNGFRKIAAAFSALPSPRRSLWPTLAYAFSYGPIMILGLAGMGLHWRSWREHCLIYFLFLSFVVVTAVFFGHTSHRAFLDVYWMAFAANVITKVGPQRQVALN